MPKDLAFLAHLNELLEPLGKISTKIMFGGHGIYCNGVIMGIAIEQELYLKVDGQTEAFFSKAGCVPFVYEMKAKTVAMSYWSVPDEAMESAEEMLPWARHAYAAALRKAETAPLKKKTKKQSSDL